jgi:hypothetical protein
MIIEFLVGLVVGLAGGVSFFTCPRSQCCKDKNAHELHGEEVFLNVEIVEYKEGIKNELQGR